MPQTIIYIDIETAHEYSSIYEADDFVKEYFEKLYRTKYDTDGGVNDVDLDVFYRNTAGLYAEFSKIVCVSLSYHIKENQFKVLSLVGDNERDILCRLADILNHKSFKDAVLAGHNIIEFDIPFICKRLLKHKIGIPKVINPTGKKTWDIKHLDTMQIAKFGKWNGQVSLSNLCYLFGIPTPKDEIDGSMVADIYHSNTENRFDTISKYCEKDVIATIKLLDILLEENKHSKVIEIIK